MRTIYEVDAQAVWSGRSAELNDNAGRPLGYVEGVKPPKLSGDQRAVWNGDGWIVRDAQALILPPLPDPIAPPESFGIISDRQFFEALATPPYSIITQQEAFDAVKTGEIPKVMQDVIDKLPTSAQFKASMAIAGGTQFSRDNPLVEIFGASQKMDAAAINAFWRFAEGT